MFACVRRFLMNIISYLRNCVIDNAHPYVRPDKNEQSNQVVFIIRCSDISVQFSNRILKMRNIF